MGLIWSSDDVPGHNPGMFVSLEMGWNSDPAYDPSSYEYSREYVAPEQMVFAGDDMPTVAEIEYSIDEAIEEQKYVEKMSLIPGSEFFNFSWAADKIGSARILKACLEGDELVLREVIQKSWGVDWLMLISQFIEETLFDEWACDFIQARIDNIKLSREIQAAKKAAAEKKKPIIVQAAQGFMPTPVRKGTHLILARTQKFLDAKLQEGYEVIGG